MLFFREKGSASSPPLLLLHGLWGASDNWLTIAELLSPYFHVILPDLRNHGRSFHSNEHTYSSLCSDIIQFINDLHQPVPIRIAGHSMGGKIVMHLLLDYPELISQAAIIDIAPKIYNYRNSSHYNLLKTACSLPLCTFQDRKELQNYLYSTIQEKNIQQLFLKNIQKTATSFQWKLNVSVLFHSLPSICSWDIPENHPPHTKPVLFIQGEKSNYILQKDTQDILTLFPLAKFQTIPQADHCIHAAQPQKLADALITFFLNHEK